MEDPDPTLARQHATLPDELHVGTLSVIGLIEAHDGAVALLRSSNGQIARVKTGDVAFGVTITAIDGAQILLTDRWGRTQSLQLPHG